MPTPRVFVMRHGETEWSRTGQYTGKTDIPLTARGIEQVKETGRMVVGHGKLMDPSRIVKAFISPRQRAQMTFDLFTGECEGVEIEKDTTEDLREWEYGLYEGMLTKDIRAARKERGLDRTKEWDIWVDGCEEGETPKQVSDRLDDLISQIRDIQSPHMHDDKPADILLVAHGHILRGFVRRWLGYSLDFRLLLMLEPGGVGVLTYDHRSLEEPAVLVGLGFPLKEEVS
ncbi:phosphoglycerate mutase-like protein [Tothia fuscella]|uniref:Phosphoglycerate mutase-like protein n=1 Tax=Tothia fuscella TaxID=1048955 RepID=A0A9P4NJK9_9PEZI|nr:phosphoglycerate mutase-like protein [Tothia fuscella]